MAQVVSTQLGLTIHSQRTSWLVTADSSVLFNEGQHCFSLRAEEVMQTSGPTRDPDDGANERDDISATCFFVCSDEHVLIPEALCIDHLA